MRKKLVWGLVLSWLTGMAILHTQMVERPLLRKVQEILAEAGLDLQAERLDINLFRFSVTLQRVQLQGHGLNAQLETVYINAGNGLVGGQIDLDAIEIFNGTVAYRPPATTTPPQQPAGPVSLPAIHLRQLALSGITLEVADQSADLNLALRDVMFAYQDSLLTSKMTARDVRLAGRSLAEARLTLSLRTETFQTFNEIQVALQTAQSHLGVTGQIKEGLTPDLTFYGEAGADVLPELPGTKIEGRIEDGAVDMSLNGLYADLWEGLPLALETQFNYQDRPLQIPLALQIGDLAEGQVDLVFDGTPVGQFRVTIDPLAAEERWPEYPLTSAQLVGDFSLGERPTAQGTLVIEGVEGTLIAKGQYRDDATTFTVDGTPYSGMSIHLAGRYDQQLTVDGEVLMPGLDVLAPFVELPSELCTGRIFLQGRGTYQTGNWSLPAAVMTVENLMLEPYVRDSLTIYLEGDVNRLRGELHGANLNATEPAVMFTVQPGAKYWEDLQVNLDTQPMSTGVDPFDYRLQLQASGAGPLQAPDLNGQLIAFLSQAEDAVARFESPFRFEEQRLTMPRLVAESAHVQVNGQANLILGETLDWDVDLVLETLEANAYRPILSEPIPHLVLTLRGSQDNLDASLAVPRQTYRWGSAQFDLAADAPFAMDMRPNQRVGDGTLPSLSISGVRLSDLALDVRDGRLWADAGLTLVDPDLLRANLGTELWPQDLDLATMRAAVALETDLNFTQPRFTLRRVSLDGTWDDVPFTLSEGGLVFEAGKITLQPFEANFAGIAARIQQADDAQVSQALPDGFDPLSRAINLRADWQLEDNTPLRAYLVDLWPDLLQVDQLQGSAWLHANLDFADPAVAVTIAELDALYDYATIRSDELSFSLYQGLRFEPGSLVIEDVPFTLEPTTLGFTLKADPTVDVVAPFVPNVVGDARFRFQLDWENREEGLYIGGSLQQRSGTLVYVDPYFAVQQLQLQWRYDTDEKLHLQDVRANVNDGSVFLDGFVDLAGEEPQGSLNLTAERVQLEMIDYQTVVDSVLEWRSDGDNRHVEGAVILSDGHFSSDLKVENLVSDLIGTVPELYFPDPVLEKTKLQLTLATQNPFIVNLPFGHLELETPSLVIGGNLAEPTPVSGPLNINEGSALKFGNSGLVFRASQIQFHPNRPNDPYLQLALESQGIGSKNALSLTGYVSDLDTEVDQSNLLAITSSYLFSSRVSSLFSFEGEISNTLFDSSFNFVVSKPLSRRIVTRYAIPLADQNQKQRFEVTIGPYLNNFISLRREDQVAAGSLLHTRRFGFPDGERPQIIRRIRFKPSQPRKIRKRFTLYSEDTYSASQWRRAEFEMRRNLKEDGYLNATLSHRYEDGTLWVDLDLGQQTELVVEGLDLTQDERERVLRNLRNLDDSGLRVAANLIESMALSKGYPSAAAFPRLEDNRLTYQVLLGQRLGQVSMDFGEATDLLPNLVNSKEQRRSFLSTYSLDERAAEAKVRARLAAKGYLEPSIGEGNFLSLSRFELPISLGPRAKLVEVVENGETIDSDHLQEPFDYSLIATVNNETQRRAGRRVSVDIQPRKRGTDIWFDVTTRVIEEQDIASLEVEGESRISARKIKRFLGFRPGMSQTRLIDAQQRLIKSGPFRMARLQSNDEQAVLEVDERHRWDADVQVTWNERSDFGYAIQFKDRQLFNGFHDFMVRAETNSREDRGLARFGSQRIWGSPLDVGLTLDWFREKNVPAITLSDGIFIDRIQQEPEKQEAKFEISYPFTQRQNLSAGIVYQRNVLRENIQTYFFTAPDDPNQFTEDNLFDSFQRELTTTLTPLRVAYIFRGLDHLTDPHNGFLGTANMDRYTKILGEETEAFVGTRITMKGTGYKTWGRWMSVTRFEVGLLQGDPPEELRPSGFEDSPFFVLGGPASVRGFESNFLGPLAFRNEGEEIVVEFLGGEASFFLSQELNVELGVYGLSLSPFVDAGWVWDQREDFMSTDLVYTGGLGLGIETPIGYFRVDWATPIDDSVFEDMLLENALFQEELEAGRRAAITEFSFRFGRIF